MELMGYICEKDKSKKTLYKFSFSKYSKFHSLTVNIALEEKGNHYKPSVFLFFFFIVF